MKELPKIIVVLGPTASGKSNLAVSLAKKYGGEIISADSRQIYSGLTIGTGKITKTEMRGIPHHLLDVLSPTKRFSVAQFKKKAEKIIKEIIKRGKFPIICGGTGFYIQSLVDGIVLPEVKANKELRAKLSFKTLEDLFTMLMNLDHTRAVAIDPNNKVRLIRAIEIATTLGHVPKIQSQPLYISLQIGIDWKDEALKKRINTRLITRMKKGMIKEAQNLYEGGLSWKRMEELGLEYRYLALYLQNKMTKREMIEKLSLEIWHYAKRQRTWFKRDPRIKWFKPTQLSKIEKEVKSFLKK